MKPLRILAIGSSGSTHVAGRVRCFADRGHHVSLLTDKVVGLQGVTELTPSAPPGQDQWIATIARLLSRLVRRDLSGPADMARLMLDFRRKLRQADADIVHIHFAYSTWAWMAAALGARPLVVSIMGGDILFEEQGSPTPRGIALTKRLLGQADLITSKSDFLIGVLNDLGGYGAKAIRVVWGVDPAVFKPADGTALRIAKGIPAEAKVVLSPKILTPFYNIHILVEAMAKIAASVPEAHLVLTEYGADPAYRAQLKQRIGELGLSHAVTFVGHITHAQMPDFYSLADVAVGIPASDGLPQTLLEAMSCGVPSVIGPLDRYGEIVQHEESALLAQLNPASVADAVVRLLRDERLYEHIATRGRAIVETEANFPQEADRVERAYERLSAAGKAAYRPRLSMLKDVALYWLRW